MTAMRLVGFEAAALRHADNLGDDELARLLSARLEYVLGSQPDAERQLPAPRAQDLRELAAAALVTARRMDGQPGLWAATDETPKREPKPEQDHHDRGGPGGYANG